MISMRDVLVEEARHLELLREAERYRLAKQVPTRRLKLQVRAKRMVVRLGEWLVTWGRWLQGHRTSGRGAA